MFVRNNPKRELLKMYDEKPHLFERIGVTGRADIENANREQLENIVERLRGDK